MDPDIPRPAGLPSDLKSEGTSDSRELLPDLESIKGSPNEQHKEPKAVDPDDSHDDPHDDSQRPKWDPQPPKRQIRFPHSDTQVQFLERNNSRYALQTRMFLL